ncbi:DUF7619 domain-containing protein [Flavobacterium sp.]|uniref:DUF7619 domain-containing protein n=1 Tax=Flavobacterium sp. TaxID=239 RepID=UPI002B4ADCB1|nr:Calx-beta domain-containing protein [Flavobacterium sp.]HLP64975.1 Calx-beta domain-containing protein [Flavobacterium sp.]
MKKNHFFTALLLLFLNTVFSQNPYLYFNYPSSSNAIEGNSVACRLAISGAIATPISTTVTTQTETALSSDFTAINTIITIPAGQTMSSIFYVNTINDPLPEENEYFRITATVTTGNTSNASNYSYIYITDDDTIPTLYSNGSFSKYEGAGNLSVGYSLSNPFNTDISFTCVSSYGTAGSADFTAINTILTIPAGQTLAGTSISITDDALIESDEDFILTTSVISGNTTNSVFSKTVSLLDNDTTPTVSIDSTLVNEGQAATVSARLNRPYNSNVVINFATSPGTASLTDYTSTTATHTILAGSRTTTIAIPTTNDIIDEPLEKFTLNATVASGNTTNIAVVSEVSIKDNDGLPDLVVFADDGGYGVNEGDTYNVIVGISDALSTNTVLQVTTQTGTAGTSDFTSVTTTVTIPAGQMYVMVPIEALMDTLQESTENFSVVVTNTSTTTFNTTTTLLIDLHDIYNIHLEYDSIEAVFGVGGNFNVLANDLLHGLPLNATDAVLTLDANPIGATLSAQGQLTIPSSTPMGYYQLTYNACEVANPTYCHTSSIYLYVKSPLTVSHTAAYFDLNGDGFTNVGDAITISYTVSNIGNAPVTNVEVTSVANVTNFTGGPIASLAVGTSDTTTFQAFYIITQTDLSNGVVANNFYSTFEGIYNGVTVNAYTDDQSSIGLLPIILNVSDGLKLNAFIDSDSNGNQNGLEVSFPYGNYDYSINGGVVHNIYASTPQYLYESDPTTVYNLTYNVDTPYYIYNSCSTSYSNVTVPTGSGIATKNFPINAIPYQDLSVHVIPFCFSPRLGEVYNDYIIYRNYSNQLVPSGTITYTKPSAVTLIGTSEPNAIINGTGFTFNFTNLLPYETRYIFIEMLVPTFPTTDLGDQLTSSASITMPLGDVLPGNNTSSLTQTVVGPYDPNDKKESHGGKILFSSFTPDDYLTYTIRFENTGTASANFVKITDVLDDKLEPSSLKMIDASADYILERIGTNLTWKFNGINLPPSIEGTTTGKGYVTFQIKPKPGYAVGDVIPNFASIYFDTNPPIVTEVFTTEFVASLGNAISVFNQLKYYPNPVKNNLYLSNESIIDTIEVNSILGQVVLRKEVNDLQTEIDFSSLNKGVYFLKITSLGESKVIKISKE